jgi:hypothetical protein
MEETEDFKNCEDYVEYLKSLGTDGMLAPARIH